MREKQFNIRLSDEELSRLERLEAEHGLTGASLMRMLLKRADERALRKMRAPEKPPVVREAKVLEIIRGMIILTRLGPSSIMFERHEREPYKVMDFFELHPSEARALGEALREVGVEGEAKPEDE